LKTEKTEKLAAMETEKARTSLGSFTTTSDRVCKKIDVEQPNDCIFRFELLPLYIAANVGSRNRYKIIMLA
jgi:hypothetical protein